MNDFRMEGTMFRYGSFMPRRYNYCKSLGFEPDKILLLRAFCSDENQGCPIILINKHYCFAQADVLLERCNGGLCLRIDNGLLRGMRNEDLFLELSRLVRRDAEGDFTPFTHTAPRRVSPPAS